MGAGFAVTLLCLGNVRELLGQGSLFGLNLLGQSFQVWTIMLLPPGGFFVLAGWVILFHAIKNRQQKQIAPPSDSASTFQDAPS